MLACVILRSIVSTSTQVDTCTLQKFKCRTRVDGAGATAMTSIAKWSQLVLRQASQRRPSRYPTASTPTWFVAGWFSLHRAATLGEQRPPKHWHQSMATQASYPCDLTPHHQHPTRSQLTSASNSSTAPPPCKFTGPCKHPANAPSGCARCWHDPH